MGNNPTKDQNIDIYVQTNKQIYTAGQFVEGAVYLNAIQNCLYQCLMIKFIGQQKSIFYIDRNTAVTLNYTKIDTYSKSIIVNKFSQKVIQKGHYIFPFKFLLPQSLPGSFCQSYLQDQGKLRFKEKNQIYIRYILSARIVPSKLNTEQRTQTFSRFINIRQPLRINSGNILNQNTVQITCCGFKMSGKTSIKIQCNKNLITPEQQIQINLLVNNKEGTKTIKSFRLDFQQHKYIVGAYSNVEKIVDKQITIKKLENIVKAGQQLNIQFKAKIPQKFSKYSTSLGRTVGKYFTLNIIGDIGLSGQITCQILVVFYSQKQYKQRNQKIVAPKDWNPLIFDKIQYNDLPPYILRQSKQIPHHNRLTNTSLNGNNSINLQHMMNLSYNQNTQHQPSSASMLDQNIGDI